MPHCAHTDACVQGSSSQGPASDWQGPAVASVRQALSASAIACAPEGMRHRARHPRAPVQGSPGLHSCAERRRGRREPWPRLTAAAPARDRAQARPAWRGAAGAGRRAPKLAGSGRRRRRGDGGCRRPGRAARHDPGPPSWHPVLGPVLGPSRPGAPPPGARPAACQYLAPY